MRVGGAVIPDCPVTSPGPSETWQARMPAPRLLVISQLPIRAGRHRFRPGKRGLKPHLLEENTRISMRQNSLISILHLDFSPRPAFSR